MSVQLVNALEALLGVSFPACVEGAKLARVDFASRNCVCGHDIEKTYWISLPDREETLPIGSTCIHKILQVAGIQNRAGWTEMDANRLVVEGMARRGQRVLERARLAFSWPPHSEKDWAAMTHPDTEGSAELIELATNRLLVPEPTEGLERLLACAGHLGLINTSTAYAVVRDELLKEEHGRRPALQRFLLERLSDVGKELDALCEEAMAAMKKYERQWNKFAKSIRHREFVAQENWHISSDAFHAMYPDCTLVRADSQEFVKTKSKHSVSCKMRTRQTGLLVLNKKGRPIFWHRTIPFARGPGDVYLVPSIIF